MGRTLRWMSLAAAVAAVAAGCETVERARKAQNEMEAIASECAPTSSVPQKINLRGFRLVDYVAWAIDRRRRRKGVSGGV